MSILLDSKVRVTPKNGSESFEGTAASVSDQAIIVTRPGERNVTVRAADFDAIEQLDPPPGTLPLTTVAPETTPAA
jgi:hypothetical protein